MAFASRLSTLRKDAGLSQQELAAAVGAAQSTISQLEAGTRQPSYGLLQAIARPLGVTVGYLISEEVEGLDRDEKAHFHEYRSLSPKAREELRAYAKFLQQRDREHEPSK
jgi:transcriptional regulator with XRE-family HTH domain